VNKLDGLRHREEISCHALGVLFASFVVVGNDYNLLAGEVCVVLTVVTEVDRGACVNRFLEGECNVLSAPKAVPLRSRVDDPPNQTIVGISRRIPTGRYLSPSRVTFRSRKPGRRGGKAPALSGSSPYPG
jgi:hypothetical protein